MSIFLQFAILGLGTGALYSFGAQGLVLVYRASGVLNFATGAIGIADAYIYWELRQHKGWAFLPAFVVCIALAGAFGAAFHWFIMRPLRTRSALVRVVATLGLLVGIQGFFGNIYHDNVELVKTPLPAKVWHITSKIAITTDRVYLFLLVLGLTAVLWFVYRYSMFGLSTSAVAENTRSAAALGWSFDRVAMINWGLGCALASTAAIFLVPIIALSVANMTALLLSTLAAALIGNFRSFWLTFAGGLAIGVIQGELDYYSPKWGTWSQGLSASVPFILIILVLVARGRALPLRDFLVQRNPTVGSGRIRPVVVVAASVVILVLTMIANADWATAIATTAASAVILLSLVVLIGYAGQLSLAQAAFAGFGAYVAAELVANGHLPFLLAVVIGVAAAIPLGVLFALPAVRTRGINLAIVTLGLGSALEYMLFHNGNYTGGVSGLNIGTPSLFGLDIDALDFPQRWAVFCVVLLIISMLLVANLRRGRTGRRLLAVRTNERAAAALGINVRTAKLYAFALAAAIASLGGVLTQFAQPEVLMTTISNVTSTALVAQVVIGGVGFLAGPLVGATITVGSVGSLFAQDYIGHTVATYLQTFSGILVLVIVLQNPNGAVEQQLVQFRWVANKVKFIGRIYRPAPPTVITSEAELQRVRPQVLEVRDVTVRYGWVVACNDISLTVEPGKVVGLIGPNGAGKTSLIDAIAGFTRISSGSVVLDGTEITNWQPARRARAGLGRTFQSLELYTDMTVMDNLKAAYEPRDFASGLVDLVWPRSVPVPAATALAIEEFRFGADLDRLVDSLPYGQRRLLAAARAVATSPSVILLDECAAGLSEAETRELALLVRRLADTWGMGVLVIEHDVNFVMGICDEIVVLDFGQKIAHGTPEEVRSSPAVVAAYLGVPEEEVASSPTATPPRPLISPRSE